MDENQIKIIPDPQAQPAPEGAPNRKTVAYFSMEYAVDKDLPIYAGGLGVLAADYLLEAGKLNPNEGLNYVFVGLYYQDHVQNEPTGAGFKILKDENDEPIWLDIDIAVRPIFARVWVKEYGETKLYLLDTNVSSNDPENKDITKNIYDPDNNIFLKQQLVLGLGSIKLFQRLKIKPDVYHLNEGHTAFVILALAVDWLDANPGNSLETAIEKIKAQVVGTKHTILPGSGRDVSSDVFRCVLEPYAKRHHLDVNELFKLGVNSHVGNFFSTTYLFIRNVSRANCVSTLHCNFERGVHPSSTLIPVTNGINADRWQSESLRNDGFSDEELWKYHQENKKNMFSFLNLNMDLNHLTLVWARRLAVYKRPLLLFSDISRISKIVNNPEKPMQIIFSGRAQAGDQESIKFATELLRISELPEFKGKMVFIPEYSLNSTGPLVAGADIWLNTPTVGMEACGTSGMKAGINGGLVLSTPDGWVGEVQFEGIGWTIKEENIEENLYSALEKEIIPEYYELTDGLPKKWIGRMQATRKIVSDKYTTKRMLKEYVEKLYFPSSPN